MTPAVVRFLIFFELVLLALLIVGRIATPSSDLQADASARSVALPADVPSPSQAAASATPAADGRGGDLAAPASLSDADRTILARQLVSAHLSPAPAEATAQPVAPSAGAEQRERASRGTPPPGVRPLMANAAAVADAQRLLARLGHPVGPADGVAGPRTRQAIRAYAQHAGFASDGTLTPALLAQLRRDAARRKARSKADAYIAGTTGDDAAPEWAGALAVGVQRLLGQEFDSLRQPRRLHAYCRTNPDTWIFDEGRRTFTYCGQVAALR